MPPRKEKKQKKPYGSSGSKHEAIADSDDEKPVVYANTAGFEKHVERLGDRDRLVIIVAFISNAEDQEMIDDLTRRISKDPERHAILISHETFQELSRIPDLLPPGVEVTIYLTGHGAMGQFATMRPDAVAQEIEPFLNQNPEAIFTKIKIASCHSADKIHEPDLASKPDILRRVQDAGLTISLVQQISTILGLHHPDGPGIFGYRGGHFEAGQGQQQHSHVDFNGNRYRASAVRIGFLNGNQIEGPKVPAAAQKPSGSINIRGEGDPNGTDFTLTY